ncbi:MAG: response regulator, partial [Betaproteobacteria bacterium]|nr:response regulator [Betaproteobacteria bacterium]
MTAVHSTTKAPLKSASSSSSTWRITEVTNTSATPARLVCIVDDDPAVRDSLALMLGLKGFDCRVFDSAEHFLKMPPSRACCLILDLRMNGMSG